MTSSAFPFLDGRTALDGPLVPRRRTRQGGALDGLRRRFHRAPAASGRRPQNGRDETDAYLDRTGLSSVDLVRVLTQQVQR